MDQGVGGCVAEVLRLILLFVGDVSRLRFLGFVLLFVLVGVTFNSFIIRVNDLLWIFSIGLASGLKFIMISVS